MPTLSDRVEVTINGRDVSRVREEVLLAYHLVNSGLGELHLRGVHICLCHLSVVEGDGVDVKVVSDACEHNTADHGHRDEVKQVSDEDGHGLGARVREQVQDVVQDDSEEIRGVLVNIEAINRSLVEHRMSRLFRLVRLQR